MPIYNGEPFLAETLESIVNQTFQDFELIISDNASCDGTEAICRDRMAEDPRIRYVRNATNLGAATNYNRVFELSSGRYFKWAAADDLCAPTFLEQCVAVLEERPEVVLCYPKTTIIDAHGNAVRNLEDGVSLCAAKVSERFHGAITTVSEGNAVFGLIRSDVLRQTALIGNYLASDRILLAQLTLYGPFYEIPERLFFRREHAHSSTKQSIADQQEFFDPRTRGKISLITWRQQFQHLVSIGRAPLTLRDKVELLFIVLHRGVMLRRRLMQEPLHAVSHMIRGMLRA
jgi:glycosyltransferase involved in cell wall biosynthesis